MINLLEVFGVEEGEVFEVRYSELNGWNEYVIKNNILWFIGENQTERTGVALNTIANAEIRRLPFVPKFDEDYWTVCGNNIHEIYVYEVTNGYFGYNIKDLELGICYRTKEQAEREGIPKMKALIEKWGGKVD